MSIFARLPEDVVWMILTEFVGGFVVRRGKLLSRLRIDDRFNCLYTIPMVKKSPIYKYSHDCDYFVQFCDKSQILLCNSVYTGKSSLWFRYRPKGLSHHEKTWRNYVHIME
jgi:hypothetical protein